VEGWIGSRKLCSTPGMTQKTHTETLFTVQWQVL
jgi:hypothetical protein